MSNASKRLSLNGLTKPNRSAQLQSTTHSSAIQQPRPSFCNIASAPLTCILLAIAAPSAAIASGKTVANSHALPVKADAFSMQQAKTQNPESTKQYFFGLSAGYNFAASKYGSSHQIKSKPDGSPSIGAQFGYRLFRHIQASLSIEHKFKARARMIHTKESTTQTVNSTSTLVNLSYLFNQIGGFFTPYIKVGAGISVNAPTALRHSTKGLLLNTSTRAGIRTTSFAWTAGLGSYYKINRSLDMHLEAAYIDRGKFRTSARLVTSSGVSTDSGASVLKNTGRLRDVQVTAGLRCKF